MNFAGQLELKNIFWYFHGKKSKSAQKEREGQRKRTLSAWDLDIQDTCDAGPYFNLGYFLSYLVRKVHEKKISSEESEKWREEERNRMFYWSVCFFLSLSLHCCFWWSGQQFHKGSVFRHLSPHLQACQSDAVTTSMIWTYIHTIVRARHRLSCSLRLIR